jgi:hypothetical protein
MESNIENHQQKADSSNEFSNQSDGSEQQIVPV